MKKIKLLYIPSCHPYQCYDHCLTWSELGFEWYSTGFYSDCNGSGDLPPIPTYYANKKYRKELKKCGKAICPNNELITKIIEDKNKTYSGGRNPYNIWNFTKEFCEQFDVFIFSHFADNVLNNLGVIDNKPTILITFGMHNVNNEVKIGILRAKNKIIRVSNNEFERNRTPLYGGHDEIIHGSVVPSESIINNWKGNKKQVCTFTNGFNILSQTNSRREYYIKIKQKCPDYPFLLFGSNNENEPLSSGFVRMEDKIRVMQDSRVHLVTGTPGSSCTYSLVEAMVIGAPVVCYGKEMWISQSYEPDKLFNHGEEILIGNTPEECSDYIDLLMKDKDLCNYLGRNARKRAIEIYGREILEEKWRKLFNNIGVNI